MSPLTSPLRRLGRLPARVLRSFLLVLVAVLVAFVRAFAGPRYAPPHEPQNRAEEVLKKR